MIDDDDDDDVNHLPGDIDDAVRAWRMGLGREGLDNHLIYSDVETTTRLINKFGLNLFQRLIKDTINHVICPLNLFSSLAILYIGSNGETFFELREFLEFGEFDDEKVLSTLKEALQLLAIEKNKMMPNYHFLNVIRVMIDHKAETSDKFHIWTKRYFNVDIDRIDFERDGHLIGDQLKESIQIDLNDTNIKGFNTNIDNKTQLIVMSAVSFKSKWDLEFPSDKIIEDDFFNDGIHKVRVKMMVLHDSSYAIAFNADWDSSIIAIPMSRYSIVFLVILPKKVQGMTRLLNNFDLKSLEDAFSVKHQHDCQLHLPQFKIECHYDFVEQFSHLRVFTDSSQMEEIANNMSIKPNNLLHKVIFEVDKNGDRKEQENRKETFVSPLMKVDHPFLFIVKDMRTETYIFMGKVTTLGLNQ